MDFTFIPEGINAVVVDNFYTPEEYEKVFRECLYVLPNLRPEDGTAPAVDSEGTSVKKNHGAFIVDEHSNMVNLMREKILSQEFKDTLINSNSLYRILYSCTKVSTLISYYKNGDYYDEHVDDSIFTAIFYAYKEPKRFSSGELNLHSYTGRTVTIEPYNNRLVLFPSMTVHSVNDIKLDGDDGYGRFAISQFIEYERRRK